MEKSVRVAGISCALFSLGKMCVLFFSNSAIKKNSGLA